MGTKATGARTRLGDAVLVAQDNTNRGRLQALLCELSDLLLNLRGTCRALTLRALCRVAADAIQKLPVLRQRLLYES